ncbi:MAG: hypothetical protein M1831_001940 [Alyxoria varia]|nr:MAG: hypothetical protein M1831_001940 [Alyxoria varia]
MADIGASTLVQHATNAHRDRDTVYHTEQMLAGDYALHFTYILAFTFPKLSIACLLLRIFNQHRIRVVLFAVIGWIIGTGIAFLIPWVLVCNPPVRHWKPDTKDGYCLNIDAMNVAVNPPNIVSDLVMLLVPLPVLWELKASVGFRLQTFLTMLTGSVGLVASVVRWGYFLKYEILSSPLDIQLKLEIWSTVEPLAYLAAACLPPMRVLFRPRAASRSSSMQRFSSRFEWSRRFHDKLQSSSVVVEDEERTITGERELDNISRSSPDYLHARHA